MSTALRWIRSAACCTGSTVAGAPAALDALFRINPTTGAFVPGVFAGGADYVLVQAQAGLEDIDDLSVSAQNGEMLGVANNSVGDRIVRIDRFTGATVDVGRIQVSGVNLDDVEGFGSDSQGTLWATHGRTPYNLYRINPITAAATAVHSIPTGGDHESVACLTGTPNRVTGSVFNDTNGNGNRNAEPGTANVTVTLYRDTNGNGIVDAGEIAVTTTTTDVQRQLHLRLQLDRQVRSRDHHRRPAGRSPHDHRQCGGCRLRHILRAARSRERLRWAMPATIGDLVWEDLDGDGVRDGGEPGIVGVGLVATYFGPDGILGSADDQTFTTTTGVGGAYSLAGLRPGTYSVAATDPAGHVLTTANDPTVVTVASGASNLTVDYGFYRPATIGDLVFEDLNSNGLADDGATGIGGVTVNLFESDGVTLVASVVTASGGGYSFSVAPGSYVVDVVESTMPSPLTLTTANEPLVVTVASGDVFDTADFGYRLETDLSVTKTDSVDPVADIGSFTYTVTVTNNGPVDATGVTVVDTLPAEVTFDATGSTAGCSESPAGTVTCSIGGLASGASAAVTIAVDVVPDTQGIISNTVSVSADQDETTPADNTDGENTRVYRPAIISDLVWYDIDGNAAWTAGEPGLAGVTVNLYDAAGTSLVATTMTDVDGLYEFDNLAPGSYVVRVDVSTLPAGMVATYDVEGAANGEALVTVTSLEINTTTDFGFTGGGSIGDFVFEDDNGNGLLDVGETTGVAGAEIQLTWAGPDGGFGTGGDDVVYATQTTGASGAYDFTVLPAGAYTIDVITHPTGATLTTGNDPASITLGATENYDLADFGYYLPSTIGDFVWLDANGDSVQDSGEAGIDNVDVVLYLDDGNGLFEPGTGDTMVATQTTASGGAYDFTGVAPGSYWVSVDTATLPAGAVLTTANQPDLVTVTSGADLNNSDFGYDIVAGVTEIVYEDVNRNGSYDLGTDTPLPGIDVTFTDSEGTVQTVSTDTAGKASVFVAPGVVSIAIDDTKLPPGYALVAGSDPTNVVAVAGAGVTDTTGYEPQGTVAEVVFLDVNGNGTLDSGEALSGIDVTFTIGATTFTRTTDATGTATLTGILAGTTVTIDVDTSDTDFPAGTVRTVGSDPTDVVVVANTTVTDTTGYQPRGDAAEVVFLDVNGDGTLDAGEALADIDVTVTIGGTPTTYTTNATGTVTITGILAGTTVTFDVDTTDVDFPDWRSAHRWFGPDRCRRRRQHHRHRHHRLPTPGHSHRSRVPGRQRQRHPRLR